MYRTVSVFFCFLQNRLCFVTFARNCTEPSLFFVVSQAGNPGNSSRLPVHRDRPHPRGPDPLRLPSVQPGEVTVEPSSLVNQVVGVVLISRSFT